MTFCTRECPPDCLKDKLRMATQLEQLKAFARWCANTVFEGMDVDGGEMQDALVTNGILVQTQVTVPCGEYCRCTDYCCDGETTECFRFAPFIAHPNQSIADTGLSLPIGEQIED